MLLVTSTKEPYQPVRLTYDVPNSAFVRKRLRGLDCVGEDAETGRLSVWLHGETLALRFEQPPSEFVAGGRKVILGVFRFPDPKRMTLEVRSIPRAIELARLLRPRMGPEVVLARVRVVNRLFEAKEGRDLDVLDKCLDRDVTVIRPDEIEREQRAYVDVGRTQEERRARFFEWHERRRGHDVPVVEDYPTAPEEETETFRDLAMGLELRALRSLRQWNGESVTLRQLIEEVVANTNMTVGHQP
jgi:ketosteroid isomerase-like protein